MHKHAFNRFTLLNGLEVLLIPKPGSPATTVFVTVKVGSEYETKSTSGISHFLEHMAFKGTITRPRAIDISAHLDGLGAEYNAFTSYEATGFYAKARNGVFDDILEIISDLYLNPTLDPQEIEKEKGVIIEEINMYEDLPTKRVGELFMEVLYGDQPAGRSIAGHKDVIQSLSRRTLLYYRNRHYTARNSFLVIAGGFPEKSVKQKIRGHFASLKQGRRWSVPSTKESQQKPRELVRRKNSDQTHLILGFRAFDIFNKRRFALKVLTDVLGGGMSSRLFQKIRGELGAAYYIGASADLFSTHGFVAAYAGVDNNRVKKVVTVLIEEFVKLKKEKVGIKELKRAKEHLIGKLMLSLETSDELGAFYSAQLALGLPLLTPDELAKKIQAVTSDEIQSIARSIFIHKHLNAALIGPFKEGYLTGILRL